MIVLIDAGNTLVKFGWLDPRTGQREPDTIALSHSDLNPLDNWLGELPRAPASAIGINVANPGLAPMLDALLRRHGCKTRWITSLDAAPGLHNGYEPPGQLGADRWVALAGLSRHVSQRQPAHREQPLMLATFGTATTIDTLAPATEADAGAEARHATTRVFCGGMILPGPAMMRSTLAVGTAQLPDADGSVTDYPTHTRQAIATGVAAAQAGAVVRQWFAGLDHFGQAPRVYSAGGGWSIVEHEVRRLLARAQQQAGANALPIEWLPTPVLSGLAGLALAHAEPGR